MVTSFLLPQRMTLRGRERGTGTETVAQAQSRAPCLEENRWMLRYVPEPLAKDQSTRVTQNRPAASCNRARWCWMRASTYRQFPAFKRAGREEPGHMKLAQAEAADASVDSLNEWQLEVLRRI